jgi:hypothetical protein
VQEVQLVSWPWLEITVPRSGTMRPSARHERLERAGPDNGRGSALDALLGVVVRAHRDARGLDDDTAQRTRDRDAAFSQQLLHGLTAGEDLHVVAHAADLGGQIFGGRREAFRGWSQRQVEVVRGRRGTRPRR